METKKNWYAVITADVLYDKELSSTQKLLMAIIANLSNEKGYCFASNAYLGEMLNCVPETISRNISVLEGRGFLGSVINLKPNGEIDYRALTPIHSFGGVLTKMSRGVDINVNGGIDENVNIITNNINNKNNNIPEASSGNENKETKTPTLHQSCIDLYNKFVLKMSGGAGAKINGLVGQKMKDIISYLKTSTKEKDGAVASDDIVLKRWKYILDNHANWDDFHKKNIDLKNIETNLQAIIITIKTKALQKQEKPKSTFVPLKTKPIPD